MILQISTIREGSDTEAEQQKKKKIGVTKDQVKMPCKAKNAHVCVGDKSQQAYRCRDCLAMRCPKGIDGTR